MRGNRQHRGRFIDDDQLAVLVDDPESGPAFSLRRMLGHRGRRPAVLAAEREALRHAQHHEDHRRPEPDRLVAGQHAHQRGGEGCHPFLAAQEPQPVGEVGDLGIGDGQWFQRN